MTEEQKQKEAWKQHFTEEMMIDMNVITPQLLNEIRMRLMVVFPLKVVEVICDPSKFTMQYDCKFHFWGSLFRKRKLIRKIHQRLAERFKMYQITVNLR